MKTSNVSAEERVEHTPTPWKVVGFSSLNNKDRGFLVKSGDEKIVLRMLAVSKNSGPVKANAEYICRAVNSHEALVSALRGLVDMYSHAWDRVDGGLMMMGGSVEKFDAAHAKAFEALKSVRA